MQSSEPIVRNMGQVRKLPQLLFRLQTGRKYLFDRDPNLNKPAIKSTIKPAK